MNVSPKGSGPPLLHKVTAGNQTARSPAISPEIFSRAILYLIGAIRSLGGVTG